MPTLPMKLFRLVFLMIMATATVAAQIAPTLQEANGLLNQSKYAEAAAEFQALTQTSPASGPAWLGLGQAFEGLNKYDAAIAAYGKCMDLHFAPVMSVTYTARAYASKGDQEQAYAWLTKASESGAPAMALQIIRSTPAFNTIKDQPRFKKITEKMKPCVSAEYRQFDFWLGNWEVKNPQGQIVGHNNVASIQGGCILTEDWTSTRGNSTGTSINYYDNRDKKWHQLYYDNTGNIGSWPPLAGELQGGKMVMLSPAGESPLYRWTWYTMSPGKVKQMAEQSTDGGKTWAITWDSVYAKK